MVDHSPTPWRLDGRTIRDAEGDVVVSTFSPANMETRRLIVEAVNDYEWALGEIHKMTVEHDELFDEAVEIRKERDRIRDLVKRIEEEVDRCHKRDGQISQYLIDAVYEARAIGEAQP